MLLLVKKVVRQEAHWLELAPVQVKQVGLQDWHFYTVESPKNPVPHDSKHWEFLKKSGEAQDKHSLVEGP